MSLIPALPVVETPVASVTTTPVVDATRPAWLPEKFKTAEEFAASYGELEKKLGTVVTPPKPADLSTVEAASAALLEKGLDFGKLSQEYLKDGKLTDASMAEIKSKGFTDDQVTSFIKGQEALSEKNTNDVFNSVGGKDRFDKLIEYAKTNLSKEETAAFNKAAESGDYPSLKLILYGVNTRYEAALGKEPNLSNGTAPGTTSDLYSTFEDVKYAMADPRYATDEVYRNGVLNKIKKSEHIYKVRA